MTARRLPTPVTLGFALAAMALATAFVLRDLRVPPFPVWFYVFAWYPTLLLLDLTVTTLGGESLLARPRALIAMLWWSAVIWLLFEALNFRLENWYYVFLPRHPAERWAGILISFATVVPAILLPERVLDRLGVWHGLRARPLPASKRDLTLAIGLGAVLLGMALAWPRTFYPLVWGAAWLIAEPLLYRSDPARSLFADIAAGRWGRIARLLLAGLLAGILWEAYNAGDRGKWIYTVPFLEELKVFEMPLVGFFGFPFFALEVWTLYHLLAPRTRAAVLLPSAGIAALVLAGIDRRTVSSTTPHLAELPGATPPVRARLAGGGLGDVFRLANLAPDAIARRADLPAAAARQLHETARLVTLRGIGTEHAARLAAAGVGTVAELGAADPDVLWARVRGSHRPTPAEVRVWVRAAQAEIRRPLRVLVWNTHAGKDGAGRANLTRVAELVVWSDADLVLLQEVDRGTARSGRVDQLEELTRRTGYGGAFGRSLDYQGGGYGIAVLSRWPILGDTTVPLPVAPRQLRAGGAYEPRVVQHVAVAAPQGTIHVLNTHLDASTADHYRLQEAWTVRRLAARLRGRAAGGLVVLGGDFNAPPGGPVLARLTGGDWRDPWPACGSGAPFTYPAARPEKRIDYLLLPSTLECRAARVVASDASDHRPILWVVRVRDAPRR